MHTDDISEVIDAMDKDKFEYLDRILHDMCDKVCKGHLCDRKPLGGGIDCHECPIFALILLTDDPEEDGDDDAII